MAQARFHGVVLGPSGEEGCLRFGFLKSVLALATWYGPRRLPSMPPPSWPDAWFDATFLHAVRKYEDTVRKFDRVAWHLDRCVEILRKNHAGSEGSEILQALSALNDIPLYLDLLLFYLRIQADSVAKVIPNLYGQAGRRGVIQRESFRRQVHWFRKKRPNFDRDYVAILHDKIRWFRKLAGETRGEGLRDLVVHKSGVYQLAQSTDPTGGDFRLHAAVISEAGARSTDVLTEISAIVQGYCEYLDATLSHLLGRMPSEVAAVLSGEGPASFQLYRFEGGATGMWAYPIIEEEPELRSF